jgi:hypothetical protein
VKLCRYHKGEIRTPPKERLFIIGLSRTGTRSVCQAVQILGLHSRHGFGKCSICLEDGIQKYLQGRCDFAVYDFWECVADIPSIHWEKLSAVYPLAKFILTTRPLNKWLRSWRLRQNNHRRRIKQAMMKPLRWNSIKRICHFGMVGWDQDVWARSYTQYNRKVLKTLKERVLLLDVFSKEGHVVWRELCGFLGRDVPSASFPYLDKGKKVMTVENHLKRTSVG